MDWRRVPSLNSLKAFSALADAGSYAAAGQKLNVTHAAVMQQVKSLEKHFDIQLVYRNGRTVSLTEEGQTLARELEIGFRHILNSVETLISVNEETPVQVSMSPVFAVKWLMPRLADFQEVNPTVTLLLNPSGRYAELKPGGIDLAIRYSRTEDFHDNDDVLIKLDMVVLGSPKLLQEHEIANPSDLQRLPWLQELGTNEVRDWFSRHGVQLNRPPPISHMPGNLIIEAVERGDGVTYTARQWFKDEIRSGKLIELFPEETGGVFHIHTLPGIKRKSVKSFVDWLKRQSAGQ